MSLARDLLEGLREAKLALPPERSAEQQAVDALSAVDHGEFFELWELRPWTREAKLRLDLLLRRGGRLRDLRLQGWQFVTYVDHPDLPGTWRGLRPCIAGEGVVGCECVLELLDGDQVFVAPLCPAVAPDEEGLSPGEWRRRTAGGAFIAAAWRLHLERLRGERLRSVSAPVVEVAAFRNPERFEPVEAYEPPPVVEVPVRRPRVLTPDELARRQVDDWHRRLAGLPRRTGGSSAAVVPRGRVDSR